MPNFLSFHSALTEPVLSRTKQLQAAILWAELAHSANDSSTQQAYLKCLELSDRNLALAPTLEMQHDVVRMQGSLAVDAASYAISLGNLPLAVEMLEQGRALLWSQVRQWRTPIDQIETPEGRELGRELLEKNRELEMLGTSANPFSYRSDGNTGDAYGTMLEKKRQLTSEVSQLEIGRAHV